MKTGKKGFTLVEVMIVMLIISLITAVAVPRVMKIRDRTVSEVSAAHLKSIEDAKVMWALDQGGTSESEPSENDLAPYIQGGFPRPVVAGTLYNIGTLIKPASIENLAPFILSPQDLDLQTFMQLVENGELPDDILLNEAMWEWMAFDDWAPMSAVSGSSTAPRIAVKQVNEEGILEEEEEEYIVTQMPELKIKGKGWLFRYLNYSPSQKGTDSLGNLIDIPEVYEGERILPGSPNFVSKIRIFPKTGKIEYYDHDKKKYEDYDGTRLTFYDIVTQLQVVLNENEI